jgi:hypothetical protein
VPYLEIIWDLDDDPDGNVQHIAEHGFTKEDVRWVLEHPTRRDTSNSSGRPVVFGYTEDDVYIIVVYEEIDDHTVYPVTAYEPE